VRERDDPPRFSPGHVTSGRSACQVAWQREAPADDQVADYVSTYSAVATLARPTAVDASGNGTLKNHLKTSAHEAIRC
jgi:hypothetical protein